MSLSYARKALENKNEINPNLKIVNTDKATFILPKNSDLRDILKFKEVKFLAIGGKKPIIAMYPNTFKIDSKKYLAHVDLLTAIVKIKEGRVDPSKKFISDFEQKMVMGNYNIKNKKMDFVSNINENYNKKLEETIKNILTQKIKKDTIKKDKKKPLKINIKRRL
jgi:hypothetical protein